MKNALAWQIVCDHSGEPTPAVHAGRATGEVRAVTEPWNSDERTGRTIDGCYVRHGVVALALSDMDAGRMVRGDVRVRREVIPGPGDFTVRASALEVHGPDAIEPTPLAMRRKSNVIRPQVLGLLARAGAGLEMRRGIRPAA